MKGWMAMLAAVTATVAIAQGQMPNGGAIEPVLKMAQNPKVAAKVGITTEQIAKLSELTEDKAAMKDLREKIRTGMKRQTELLSAEKIDEAAVMSALDDLWASRKEVAKMQTKRLIAVRGILSAEQVSKVREELKSMRAERRRVRGEGKKRGDAEKAESEKK